MMIRRLLPLFALTALPLMADTVVKTFTLTGRIEPQTELTVSNLDPSDSSQMFSDVTAQNMADGFITISAAVQLSGVSTNSPVFLKVKNLGWTTLPGDYDTSNGSKKADGSGSDLQFKVDTGSLSATGPIAAEGGYASNYTAVNNTAANILKLGDIVGGVKTGMTGGSGNFDAKVLLSPVYDIPGDYGVEVELSIAAQI